MSEKNPYMIDASTFSQHVHTERELTRIAIQIGAMASQSRLSRRQIAERMGMASPSTVQRTVSGANVTLETLMRFATACGYRLEVRFIPQNKPAIVYSIQDHIRKKQGPSWSGGRHSAGTADGHLCAA